MMTDRIVDMTLDVAVTLTRAWTRLYTRGLPPDVAAERCAEVDCDLWEMQHDASSTSRSQTALRMLARVVDGVADDVAWRMEQGTVEQQLRVRKAVAVVVAGVLVLGLWTVPLMFAGGMRGVDACADRSPAPETSADLRLELVRCAGAFFLARD